jgi:hypothetical protein
MVYKVIENGPDAFDYVFASFGKPGDGAQRSRYSKISAEILASKMQSENAYLGYGYHIEECE